MRIFAMCILTALAGVSAGQSIREPVYATGSPQAGQSASRDGGQAGGTGTWSESARLGDQRTEAAVVAVNGKIYMLGGMARGQDAHALNQEYDPATDRWRERAPMPHALSHAGAAALNGKIYVVGGFLRNVHLDAQNLAFEYDPSADTWRTLAPMKSPRGAVGVVALNGKIHAIGGRDVNRVTVATHEVYDPATGRWGELGPLPKARDHLAAIAVDGKIHVIGGRFDASTDNTGLHDVYDPAGPGKPVDIGGAAPDAAERHLGRSLPRGDPDRRRRMQQRQAVHRARRLQRENGTMVAVRADVVAAARHPGRDRRTHGVRPRRRAGVRNRRVGYVAEVQILNVQL